MPDKIGRISYPISNDWRFEKFWDKNIELHGIAGWFTCCYGASQFTDQAAAFGGYLKLKKEEGSFDDEIVDMWGRARIAGVLGDTNLNFNKIYVEKAHIGTCSTLIHYDFSKLKRGNVWKGEFVITNFHPNEFGRDLLEVSDDLITVYSTLFKGRSCCKIYPVLKNAYGIISGPIRIE